MYDRMERFNFSITSPSNTTLNEYIAHDPEAELDALNDEKAKLYTPVILYVAFLMLVGTTGNVMVIYIYNWKLKRHTASFFISTMAIFDLLGCLISMPLNMYDLLYPYTFYDATGCKTLRFTESVTVYGSAIILLFIAFDRYFKVCKPLRIIAPSKIKLMCISSAVLAVGFSSPCIALFGITRTVTPINGTLGYDCIIDQRWRGGAFPKVYYNMLSFLFACTLSCLGAFYVRIWIEIKRRRDTIISDHVESSTTTPSSNRRRGFRLGTTTSDDDPTQVATANTSKANTRITSVGETPKIKLSRTTVIFLTVSIAYIVSYLPAIVINILRSYVRNFQHNLTPTGDVLIKLCARFYYINNSINPLIYSYFNYNYRKQCNKVIAKFVFCCKKTIKRNSSDRSAKERHPLARKCKSLSTSESQGVFNA